MPRKLGYYDLHVQAGPQLPLVHVLITYRAKSGEELGLGGGSLMAFGATWKDVATFLHQDVARLGIHDTGGMRSASPHLDLT